MSQHHDYHLHHEESTFNAALVDQLRKTPWLLVSLIIHAGILLVLSLFGTAVRVAETAHPIQIAHQPVIPDQVMPEVPLDTEEIKPDVEPTETPVITDDVAQVVTTDTQEEWDEPKGVEDAISNRPFDGTQTNDAGGFGGGGANAFGRRRGGSFDQGTKGGGGRPTRIAVDQGLSWLKAHQSPDGSWDCDGFMANGDPKKGPLCDGKGIAVHDVGVSGLALLCFLGAGHTHREGAFRDTVRTGLKWMRDQQDAEGCFGPRSDPHFTYDHAIAALAMAEAYGMTGSALWKRSAQKGIDFIQAAQNPYKAWRYGARSGENDVSVTGWMVMALKSAQIAGLDASPTSMEWAYSFIKEMTDEDTGRTGYLERGSRPVRADGRLERFPVDESESLTAVGMLTRIFNREDPARSPMLKAGAELCLKRLPVWEPSTGKVDMYYWYYATLAMFQMGGSAWTAWNDKMKPAIVESQRKDGNFSGSWDPVDPWGEDGGRVYSTAVMTLCLEVYYRYHRVFGTR